jgi:hypothetical protein
MGSGASIAESETRKENNPLLSRTLSSISELFTSSSKSKRAFEAFVRNNEWTSINFINESLFPTDRNQALSIRSLEIINEFYFINYSFEENANYRNNQNHFELEACFAKSEMKTIAIAVLVIPFVKSLPFASAVLEEKKTYTFLESISKNRQETISKKFSFTASADIVQDFDCDDIESESPQAPPISRSSDSSSSSSASLAPRNYYEKI